MLARRRRYHTLHQGTAAALVCLAAFHRAHAAVPRRPGCAAALVRPQPAGLRVVVRFRNYIGECDASRCALPHALGRCHGGPSQVAPSQVGLKDLTSSEQGQHRAALLAQTLALGLSPSPPVRVCPTEPLCCLLVCWQVCEWAALLPDARGLAEAARCGQEPDHATV